jgi:hypothetical protein
MTNLTASFLGDEATWRRARISASSVHGLWGGYIISVGGDGAALICLIDPGQRERRYALAIGQPAAQGLLRRCVEHDLLAIDLPERASLVPDEAQVVIQLAAGRRGFSLTTWANDPPHAGLNDILTALLALRQQTEGLAPVYDGLYSG